MNGWVGGWVGGRTNLDDDLSARRVSGTEVSPLAVVAKGGIAVVGGWVGGWVGGVMGR